MADHPPSDEGRIIPLLLSDLLVAPKSPSLSLLDILADGSASKPPATVVIRRPRCPVFRTTFQCPLPKKVQKLGPDKESWFLRCFCDIDAELGNMIQCEKCLNWQHQACLRLNANTTPNNYVCPICSGIHIRCACKENLNYRLTLIKCTKCGYYVHKKCEGLDLGPYCTNTHVCRLCGGIPSSPPDVLFPYNPKLPDPVVHIDKNLVDRLHPSFLTAPFAAVLTQDFLNQDVSALKFCEAVYNQFRPFFFLLHPQVASSSPKKRRADVSFSFFRAIFYALELLYDIKQEVAIAMFDTLAKLDIYLSYDLPLGLLPIPSALALDFSELAKAEFDKSKHIPDVPQASLPRDFFIRGDGLYCQSPLQAEQLIALAGGFVGLIDEFTYENGVDHRFYVACGTKFVVDTRKSSPQLIHNFRRSLSPNCVLKLVKCAGVAYAAVYAWGSNVNVIARRTRREKFSVPANPESVLHRPPSKSPPNSSIGTSMKSKCSRWNTESRRRKHQGRRPFKGISRIGNR
jgi:hypothetical protein